MAVVAVTKDPSLIVTSAPTVYVSVGGCALETLPCAPGELFIVMAKEGSTISGLMDSFATSISLALQYGVREQGTAARLARLAAQGHIDEGLARDLLEALHLLMGVRLTHQLQQRDRGLVPGNEVKPSELSTLEREPLRHALAIVGRLRPLKAGRPGIR